MAESDPFAIDLDAERASRAAEREGKNAGAPIRVGGQTVATLPPELPFDALAPLRNLDADITLLIRSAMAAARTQGAERMDQTALIIDLLAANPALPMALVDTVGEMTKALVGEDGYQGLVAARLTVPDVAALVKRTFAFYGVGLGEASAPSDSSENGGTTSLPTGSTTTESTSEEPGAVPVTPDSLVSASS